MTNLAVDRRLSIDDLIDTHDLWVKNATSPRFVLALTIIDRAGRTTAELIPDTPHPIHLSNVLTKDTLIGCMDLRRYLQSGSLKIVPPDEAVAYFSRNPNAQSAVNRAYAKVQNREPISRDAIASTDLTAKSADRKVLEDTVGIKMDQQGVNMKVKSIMMMTKTGDPDKDKNKSLTVEDAILDLSNMDLTDMDIQHMILHGSGPLREYAKTQDATRNG